MHITGNPLKTAAPNLFGTRGQFFGRQFSHRPGGGKWFRDESSASHWLCTFYYCHHSSSISDPGARSWGLGAPGKRPQRRIAIPPFYTPQDNSWPRSLLNHMRVRLFWAWTGPVLGHVSKDPVLQRIFRSITLAGIPYPPYQPKVPTPYHLTTQACRQQKSCYIGLARTLPEVPPGNFTFTNPLPAPISYSLAIKSPLFLVVSGVEPSLSPYKTPWQSIYRTGLLLRKTLQYLLSCVCVHISHSAVSNSDIP